jgi:hypothetical protein
VITIRVKFACQLISIGKKISIEDLGNAGVRRPPLHFESGRICPTTRRRLIERDWRLMAPPVQLVPREKYDVIRYIRQITVSPPLRRGEPF